MKPRAILFDFDLTLVDSSAAIIECANHALRAMNYPTRTPAEIAATIGLPPRKTFPIFTGQSDPHLMDAYLKHWVARADEVTLEMVTLYDPVPSVLAKIRQKGLKTAIVSTRFRYRIQAILAHRNLPNAVDLIVGGEDVASHKPDPEGLKLALAKLDVEPRDAVYVGDHEVDAQAASRAGAAFIGVLTGQSTREGLLALGAREVVDSVADLARVLKL